MSHTGRKNRCKQLTKRTRTDDRWSIYSLQRFSCSSTKTFQKWIYLRFPRFLKTLGNSKIYFAGLCRWFVTIQKRAVQYCKLNALRETLSLGLVINPFSGFATMLKNVTKENIFASSIKIQFF